MPEESSGKGLLTKESIQRTIKSKWFLPALGVGGAVVVLLIVMNKRSGGSSASEDFVAEGTTDEAPLGSAPGEDIGAMFDDLAGSISTQNQQNQDQLQSIIEGQNALLDSALRDLYGAMSNIQTPNDPYSNLYASDGFNQTDQVYSDYGYDDPGDMMTPVLEQSTVDYLPRVGKETPTDKTTALKSTTSDLRDSSGGKTVVNVRDSSGGKTVTANPVKVAPTTPLGKPAVPGLQTPGGTGVRTGSGSGAKAPAAPTKAPPPPPAKAPAKPAPAKGKAKGK